jgi:VanZ family protein
MANPHSNAIFDRPGDARLHVHGLLKPAVLRRSTLRWLCLLTVVLIVYGTLGPLGTSPHRWIAMPTAWRWLPLWHDTDANDVLTNGLTYLAVGVALRLLVRRRGMAGWRDFSAGLVISVGLSLATEALQQAMPARSSNLADVAVNSGAAWLGCVVAPLVQRWLRRVHAILFVGLWRHSPLVLAVLSVATAAVLMTLPWELKDAQFDVRLRRAAEWQDLQRIGMFGVLGFFVARALAARSRGGGGLALGVTASVLIAGVLELSQARLGYHCAALHDLVIQAVAATGGALLARWTWQTAAQRSVAAAASAALMAVAAVCVFEWPAVVVGEPRVEWIPFQHEFQIPFKIALLNGFESLAAYSFVSLLLLALSRGRQPAAAALAGVAAFVLYHCWVSLLGGRALDVTQVLLALLAWCGSRRLWASLHPDERIAAEATTASPN